MVKNLYYDYSGSTTGFSSFYSFVSIDINGVQNLYYDYSGRTRIKSSKINHFITFRPFFCISSKIFRTFNTTFCQSLSRTDQTKNSWPSGQGKSCCQHAGGKSRVISKRWLMLFSKYKGQIYNTCKLYSFHSDPAIFMKWILIIDRRGCWFDGK